MQVSSSQTVPVAASPSLLTTKGWSLDGLLASGPRFKRVPRISATSGLNELFLKIVEHENKGIPLIIEGWQDRPEWPQNLFDLDWLKETHGSQGTSGCSSSRLRLTQQTLQLLKPATFMETEGIKRCHYRNLQTSYVPHLRSRLLMKPPGYMAKTWSARRNGTNGSQRILRLMHSALADPRMSCTLQSKL